MGVLERKQGLIEACLRSLIDSAKNMNPLLRVRDLDLRRRSRRDISSRVKEEVNAQKSRSHLEAEYELYKEERDVLGGGMWEVNERDMKSFDMSSGRGKQCTNQDAVPIKIQVLLVVHNSAK